MRTTTQAQETARIGSPLRTMGEALAFVAMAAHAAILAALWARLPERIPQHFDLAGNVDGWGSRGTLPWLLVVAVILYGTLTLLQRYPQIYNFPLKITPANAPRQYSLAVTLVVWLKALVSCLFAFMTWNICHIALGGRSLMGPIPLLALVIAFPALLIVYLVAAFRQA